MPTYKCGYCGATGTNYAPPRYPCLPGRSGHGWRPMSENRICTWKCRKCGAMTSDDQTPNPKEGGNCPGGNVTHTWDRMR